METPCKNKMNGSVKLCYGHVVTHLNSLKDAQPLYSPCAYCNCPIFNRIKETIYPEPKREEIMKHF